MRRDRTIDEVPEAFAPASDFGCLRAAVVALAVLGVGWAGTAAWRYTHPHDRPGPGSGGRGRSPVPMVQDPASGNAVPGGDRSPGP